MRDLCNNNAMIRVGCLLRCRGATLSDVVVLVAWVVCGISPSASAGPPPPNVDERWAVTVNGQTIWVDADGSFRLPNVADDSTESVGEAISRTHRNELVDPLGSPNHDPFGKQRVDEAIATARGTLDPHLRNIVAQHVGPAQAIKSMEEFEALRFIRPENLTPEQVQAIVAIRNAIPNPVTGTKMQKVIKGTDIDGFIGSNSNFSGFVAKQDDAGTAVFNNSDNMIEGLRLDYEGGFQGQTSVGVVEWDFDEAAMAVDVPRTVSFGGDITVPPPYPFVGNGFTATKSGRLVPEYALAGTATPPNGAKLFELRQDGTKVLRAEYINGMWVPQ